MPDSSSKLLNLDCFEMKSVLKEQKFLFSTKTADVNDIDLEKNILRNTNDAQEGVCGTKYIDQFTPDFNCDNRPST